MSYKVFYSFFYVGAVWAVRCVGSVYSVKVFVESYMSCDNVYSCPVPYPVVDVGFESFKNLVLVFVYYLVGMNMLISIPPLSTKVFDLIVDQILDVVKRY